MGANLNPLFKLQEIETRLAESRRGLEARRRQLAGAARRVEHCLQEHENTLNRARDRQRAADALDLEVKSREETIAKFREALNHAKSNREYAAVLTELNTAKADNAKREEQALQMMTEVDAVREQAGAQLAHFEKEKRRLAELDEAFKPYEASVSERIDALCAQRAELTADMPSQLLATFERVAAKHDGEGLAEVVQDNPRRHEYSCGGCSMAVTLEQVNTLCRGSKMVTCNSCGRILHLGNGTPNAL